MSAATLQEIAAALGVSRQAVAGRAKREQWIFFTEPHPGGFRQKYPLEALPSDIKSAVEDYRKPEIDRLSDVIIAMVHERFGEEAGSDKVLEALKLALQKLGDAAAKGVLE